MSRAVVVGAGMAGLRTAEALRKNGFDGELVLVGEEPHLPYNRPPLSKEVLAAEVEHGKVAFPLRAAMSDVTWVLGNQATALDLQQRTVSLSDGETLSFDGLVVATGLRPRRLPIADPAPSRESGRHILRTLDDAAALRAELTPGTKVVVLGAGFIGCEVAATAQGLGCDVTCVAIDEYPMVRPLGAEIGAQMQRHHEARGVRFRLGTGVTGFVTEHGRVSGVELSTGEVLDAAVVVEAISSHCNTEWLAGSGLDLTDGVLVDSVLRACTADGTSVDGVHAVGDLARFVNPLFDDVPRRVEHWNIPTETGRRAGAALASYLRGDGYEPVARTPFAPMPAFWSDQYELRIQSYGMLGLADPDGVRLLEGELAGEFVMGFFRGDVLVGVLGLGMLPQTNAYRSRIGHPFDDVPAGVSA
jgi:3-phenylpropionate/trans-cinnamate dioxygenase ferredoxin reductase component